MPSSRPGQRDESAVFRDPTGARWRRVRRFAWLLGAVTTILAGAIVVGILVPPALPGLASGLRSPGVSSSLPRLASSRGDRARLAARQRLFSLIGRPAPDAKRASVLPLHATAARRIPAGGPVTAAFYVNWDDNSFVSLKAHAAQIDWLVCEWLFLNNDGDSLRTRIDRRVLFLRQSLPVEERPHLLAMLTNYDSARADFDPALLQRVVGSAKHRAAIVAQTTSVVRTYALSGVTVDFEAIPEALHPQVLQFLHELKVALAPFGAVVTQAVSPDIGLEWLGRYSAVTDRVFLMLYDEHSGRQDAGPVASQSWYVEQAQRMLKVIPAGKAIFAIGAYGYDWNDAQPNAQGDERTFQDVMRAARRHAAVVRFDASSLNPYLTWTDPDSTDHVVWYLDAVTAFNQMKAVSTLGTSGVAVWRLGSEDPSLWRVLGREASIGSAD